MDGGQTVVRVTSEDGPRTAVLTAAGMIGLTGANSAGLGVCVNALSMLRHSPDRRMVLGVPVAHVEAADERDQEDAEANGDGREQGIYGTTAGGDKRAPLPAVPGKATRAEASAI